MHFHPDGFAPVLFVLEINDLGIVPPVAMFAGKPAVTLTRSEFAAVRAYVQGMPAGMVAARYLSHEADDDDDSNESGLRMLLGLRDRMVQLAHQHGRQDLAALLELGPGRSNRGMDRRVDALAALERLGPARPTLSHAVDLWFAPALARRLRKAGIETLKALCDCANTRGTGWWRRVPRVGRLGGSTVNAWLVSHRATLRDKGSEGLMAHIVERGDMPVVALAPDMARLVPFHRLLRSMGCEAGSPPVDRFEAGVWHAGRWLESSAPEEGPTRLAYRKEVERLLLWAATVRNKALVEIDAADCAAYLAFLSDPEPAARWCGPRASRDSQAWRPFTGPLSGASRLHTVRVLRALAGWLAANGVSHGMAWHVASDAVTSPAKDVESKDLVVNDTEAEPDVAPFLQWLAESGQPAGETRARSAEAAIRLLRASGKSFRTLCRMTVYDASAWLSGALRASDPDLRPALLRHLSDRKVPPGTPETRGLPLLSPPAAVPTPQARRRREAAPCIGYSVRGLHALIATMLRRYREGQDPACRLLRPSHLVPGRRIRAG